LYAAVFAPELPNTALSQSSKQYREENRRNELTANRCPLQLAEPGAVDSSNPKGETDE
jgi:hypothetical protein